MYGALGYNVRASPLSRRSRNAFYTLQSVRHLSSKKPSRHVLFYKHFGMAFTKVCATAIGTYYGLIFLQKVLDDGKNDTAKANN